MAPASIRYKNPGAMWGNPIAKKWGSTQKVQLKDGTGQNNNIAVFPTYVQGICAQLDLWRTSKHYKNKKFTDAIRIWSGGNHVESYIKFVLARVPGMTRDTIMNDDFWRGPMGIAFLKAQAWHEAGQKYPAPDGDWLEAQRRVFGGAVVKEVTPKPVIKSKSIAAEVVSLLSLVLAYVTDIRFLLVVVAVVSVFVIVDRYRKGDLVGFFRSPQPAPVKKRKNKK